MELSQLLVTLLMDWGCSMHPKLNQPNYEFWILLYFTGHKFTGEVKKKKKNHKLNISDGIKHELIHKFIIEFIQGKQHLKYS